MSAYKPRHAPRSERRFILCCKWIALAVIVWALLAGYFGRRELAKRADEADEQIRELTPPPPGDPPKPALPKIIRPVPAFPAATPKPRPVPSFPARPLGLHRGTPA